MAEPNSAWTELLATTLKNYQPGLVDNIFNSSALLYELKKTQKVQAGGEHIVVRLGYGKNPNVKFYSGLDILDMNTGKIISAVDFNWKNFVGSVVIPGDERRKNKGKHKMIDLVEAKVQNCEDTMVETLNQTLYGDGTGSGGDAFLGLKAIVTNTGTLAGINRTVNTWWQANYSDAPDTETWGGTNDTIHKAMRAMFHSCSRGMRRFPPNLVITTQSIFELYENSMVQNIRYTTLGEGDVSFEAILFSGKPMVWDADCTAGYMYFLNTKFLYLVFDTEANFTPTPFQSPYNQDAVGNHILAMGNLVCSQARKQGLIYGITES